jgi:hypothetical protein
VFFCSNSAAFHALKWESSRQKAVAGVETAEKPDRKPVQGMRPGRKR